MKHIFTLLFVALCQVAFAQAMGSQEVRSLLLGQLITSHNRAAWYVPANTAIEGLTAEQASWKDGSGNHSIGQLTHHLVFWNEGNLKHLSGEKEEKFTGTNEETFDKFDPKTWNDLVKRLDAVMTGLEKLVTEASDAKLKEIAPTIANICAHNAYHIGQIIFVRKEQKSWNPEKGVK